MSKTYRIPNFGYKSSYYKNRANRKVRKTKNIGNYGNYKKHYLQWNIVDYYDVFYSKKLVQDQIDYNDKQIQESLELYNGRWMDYNLKENIKLKKSKFFYKRRLFSRDSIRKMEID